MGSAANGDVLTSLLGIGVSVETMFDDNVSGRVYAYDAITGTLTIEYGQRFRILKAGYIKSVKVIQQVSSKDLMLTPSPVNLEAVSAREAHAIKKAGVEAVRRGVGVTPAAQSLFDALSRTLPCRWAGKAIIVLDEVRIDPPYQPANCRADDPNAASLARVRKVVENELRRIKE